MVRKLEVVGKIKLCGYGGINRESIKYKELLQPPDVLFG